MKISINAVIAHCRLFYFQYFLQLMLELAAIFFYFISTKKKDVICVKVLSFVPALKQQQLTNGKSQTNRDQKSNLLFLQQQDQSQKFRIRLVKNRQKTLPRHGYLLYWIHYN